MAFVKDTSRIWSCKTERNKMGSVISTPNGAEITLMSGNIISQAK